MQVTAPAVASRSARLFVVSALMGIGFWGLNLLVAPRLTLLLEIWFDLWFELPSLVMVTALLVFGVVQLAGAVDRPRRLWALAGVALATTGLSAVSTVLPVVAGVELELNQRLMAGLNVLVGPLRLVERGLFYGLLVDLAGPSRRRWMLLLAAAAMLVTLVSVVESMLLSFGSVELIMSLGSGWSPQVQAGLTVVGLAFPLVMTLGASAGVPVGRATGAPSASNDFVVGGLLLTVGLVVSIGSFVLASSGSGGGPYVIATGAIAVGLLRLLRGGARAPRDEDPSRDR